MHGKGRGGPLCLQGAKVLAEHSACGLLVTCQAPLNEGTGDTAARQDLLTPGEQIRLSLLSTEHARQGMWCTPLPARG